MKFKKLSINKVKVAKLQNTQTIRGGLNYGTTDPVGALDCIKTSKEFKKIE